jgi:hypothetical protein
MKSCTSELPHAHEMREIWKEDQVRFIEGKYHHPQVEYSAESIQP